MSNDITIREVAGALIQLFATAFEDVDTMIGTYELSSNRQPRRSRPHDAQITLDDFTGVNRFGRNNHV